MEIIEGQTFERYEWTENGKDTYAYICVPITLLIMKNGEIHHTQFIFWN